MKRVKGKIFKLSLFLNIIFILLFYNTYVLRTGVRHAIEGFLKAKKISTYDGAKNNDDYVGLYSTYLRKQANIVMLGDSITQMAEWNELLDRNDIVNRGISGDNILGMLNRISFVSRLSPKICFILGGVNDLKSGVSAEEVFDNYKKIVANLKEHNVIPVIQSTLYSNMASSEKVERLNRLLKKYAEDNELYYIDLNAVLATNKSLRKEYSADGTHLTAKGYEFWREEVGKALMEYGL